MNIEESKEQLETLIESWQLNEADLDQIDIEAIKCLLEENKKLHLRDTYTNITHSQFQTEKKEKRYYENILDELEKWLEENIRENTPNYRCLWLNEDESKKMEEINSPKIIMKPTYILYQEVLEKLNELKGE